MYSYEDYFNEAYRGLPYLTPKEEAGDRDNGGEAERSDFGMYGAYLRQGSKAAPG